MCLHDPCVEGLSEKLAIKSQVMNLMSLDMDMVSDWSRILVVLSLSDLICHFGKIDQIDGKIDLLK